MKRLCKIEGPGFEFRAGIMDAHFRVVPYWDEGSLYIMWTTCNTVRSSTLGLYDKSDITLKLDNHNYQLNKNLIDTVSAVFFIVVNNSKLHEACQLMVKIKRLYVIYQRSLWRRIYDQQIMTAMNFL